MEYSGCSSSESPGVPACELSPGHTLDLWARTEAGARLSLLLDGELPRDGTLDSVPRAGGTLFRLMGDEFGDVEVRAHRGRATARFRLAVGRPERPAFLDEAFALGRSGELEGARSLLEERLSAPLEERWRGSALAVLARVEERAGRAQRARELLLQAVEHHRRQGDLGREISDRCLLVRVAYYGQGDFSTALEELERVPPPPPGDADSHYLVALYRGILALYTGDSRSAYAGLAAARDQRNRLGDAQGRWVSTQMLARLLRRLGRAAAAQALLEELTSDAELLEHLGACQRAELLNNVGWDRLLAHEEGSPAGDPLPPLEGAFEAWSAGKGCWATERPSIELNLALAHFYGGDLERADRHLLEARRQAGDASPRLLLWQLDLEARLDLRHDRLEAARRKFRRLGRLAVTAGSLEARWRAQRGLGQVAEAAGRPGEALEAYSRAEDLLDEVSLRAPLGLGRTTSVRAGGEATRHYLDLLLAAGRGEPAMQAARRSRSRILRGLVLEERVARLDEGQRARLSQLLARHERLSEELDRALAVDWQLPRWERSRAELERREQRRALDRLLDDALALVDSKGLAVDPGPLARDRGEAVLLYHRLPEGWAAFVADDAGVTTARLEALSPALPRAELARRLLGPFRSRLQGASKVRILAGGWLEGVDFHLLDFGDGRPGIHAPVAYSLDLPPQGLPRSPPREGSRTAPKTLRALVIADPTETLSAVRGESSAVATRLRSLGVDVSLLLGSAADRQGVLGPLGTVDLLHFAGHADPGGGLDGALLLAGESRLLVSDVLVAPSVPASVVLAACQSGRPGGGGGDPFLGLAQAFLIAGSREVLATSRPVDDGAAAEVVAAVYRHWEGRVPLASALHRARLARRSVPEGGVNQEETTEDWAAFRVFER